MKTLRQVMQSIEPNGQVKTVREIESLLDITYPPLKINISLRQVLEAGSKYRRIVYQPLTFMWQNIALFPSQFTMGAEATFGGIHIPDWLLEYFGKEESKTFNLYKGTARLKVPERLKQFLSDPNGIPDVVGLCEFWVPNERDQFINELANYYPYHLQGPKTSNPENYSFEYDVEYIDDPTISPYGDGGLLLLSRYPIVASAQDIYNPCEGEDCLTTKGILYARIEVPGHPMQYDIFITHMQSCPVEEKKVKGRGSTEGVTLEPFNPGSISSYKDRLCDNKLRVQQNSILRDFIKAHCSPDRPALLMGDLNQNSRGQVGIYNNLKEFLYNPRDLWVETTGEKIDSANGITSESDSVSSFKPGSSPLSPDDQHRHKDGSRYDYFFSWPGGHSNINFFGSRSNLFPVYFTRGTGIPGILQLQIEPNPFEPSYWPITTPLPDQCKSIRDEIESLSKSLTHIPEWKPGDPTKPNPDDAKKRLELENKIAQKQKDLVRCVWGVQGTTPPGRDLSDHYGLIMHLKCVREYEPSTDPCQSIRDEIKSLSKSLTPLPEWKPGDPTKPNPDDAKKRLELENKIAQKSRDLKACEDAPYGQK
jgi:endonuclease/exonuclease/phosphatase family metal-dependent hydrolase